MNYKPFVNTDFNKFWSLLDDRWEYEKRRKGVMEYSKGPRVIILPVTRDHCLHAWSDSYL
jgi:hypothetical protein